MDTHRYSPMLPTYGGDMSYNDYQYQNNDTNKSHGYRNEYNDYNERSHTLFGSSFGHQRREDFRYQPTSMMPSFNRNIDFCSRYQRSEYSDHHYHRHQTAPLSPEDQYRKKIAEENRKIVLRHPDMIDWSGVETIGIDNHLHLSKDVNKRCVIRVFECSTIRAAIECHNEHPRSKICALNFANSIKPGGGYLNGRNAQEECLCRQTLLYPTLDRSYMYSENKRKGSRPEASDIMIYSPNVIVIRDDDYKMIKSFKIDVISSPAVDNRNGNIRNSEEIMLNRIRKIVMVAASKRVDVLILGAFGCGVFKNDPTTIARIFHKVLVEEGYKKYFYLVIFPIYNNSHLYQIFNSILGNK